MFIQLDGITFSFLAAILFGASAVSARVALRGADMVQGAMFAVLTGLPVLVIVAFLAGEFSFLGQLTWTAVLVLGLSGILNFLVGRIYSYRAIEAIGANRTYALITTFPIYASLLAVVFIGESLTTNSFLAIILIVAGGIALSRSNEADSTQGFSAARFGKGLKFGLLTGLLFGVSNFLTRVGVRQTPFPIIGATISFSFALVGYLVVLKPSGVSLPQAVRGLKRPRLAGWFVVDGFIRALALISTYTALQSTPVVIVSPIIAAQVLFALVFTYAAIRKFEAFSAAVLVGAVLIMTGIVVLYLPTI